MKSFSTLVHRTPWWVLILGGLFTILALALFVTPFHMIEYHREAATPEEAKAIKREIDNTFAEGAMDIARSTILALRGATSDPGRREELDRALEEIDNARAELRDAGREVQRAKREAIETARDAARDAASAIEDARRSAEEALRDAGLESGRMKRSSSNPSNPRRKPRRRRTGLADVPRKETRIVIGPKLGKDRPFLEIEPSKDASGEKKGVKILGFGEPGKGPSGSITLDLDDVPKPPVPPTPPSASTDGPPAVAIVLPPEVREQIRRNVSGDLQKIGVGAALVLLFIPLFIMAVVAKFFIDRSRAAQRLADLKRKEAEYHRMSQQVTEAKLQALQAQVEPHFLYNTLANVQALTEVDPGRANTMVGHLIQYLRNALPKMRESVSTVGQEIELVRAYLNILQMRMGKRLSFDISVPESLLATPFPPLMLPSLVENAIQHGLEPQRDGGSVLITAQAHGGRLRLVVSDTGRGFGETVGTGVGLTNIRERLAALYGDAGKLTLESNSPGGVVATIEVPLEGLRTGSGAATADPGAFPGYGADALPDAPKTTAGKVLSAVGSAERTWRKTLSFAFVALVVVAAVVLGLGAFGVLTGVVPVQVGSETITGPGGALLGAAGIAIAFVALVVVLAAVSALVYGLGWLLVGLVIFIPVVVIVALAPALAPVLLVVLFFWWLLRRKKSPEPAAAPKVEPVMYEGPSPSAPDASAAPAPPPEDKPPAG
ncbi:MAG: histidine kinase [Betaproteobacteria bacterium]|nr:histidine kinase [Betaproteobacteria bacterium]